VVIKRKPLSYFSKTLIAGFFLVGLILSNYLSPASGKANHSKSSEISCSANQTIQEQIEFLNSKTPLELINNSQVNEAISYFLTERKEDLEIYLSRSELYFPIIESYLDKYNLPLELKYLAVIESGLNPKAKSKSGAKGVWQFLYNTCALLDLKVDSYIDERCDIYKSTDAACRYLVYLYSTFNNWELAIAAYNSGPGAIKKAIDRSGGKNNFWEIQAYLPSETAKYIPNFIAINYLLSKPVENHLTPNLLYTFSNLDTVTTFQAVSFEQITHCLNISIEELSDLNPMYTKNYIPELKSGAILVLPNTLTENYKKNQALIYSKKIPQQSYLELSNQSKGTKNKTCITHIVKHGEFFHKLAMQYNCSIENIKAWNKIDTNDLHPGQHLIIWVDTKF
jgi:membrane-bound lytic murein transglycosylase D